MRKQRIDKIEARIDRLNDIAAELLEREEATAIKLEDTAGHRRPAVWAPPATAVP